MESNYRLLIDTNIILDVLLEREPFYKSSKHIFDLCKKDKIKCMVSAKSICDIFYIVHNALHDSNKAYEAISSIEKLMTIVPLHALDILVANDLKWNDFEDCLMYLAAKDNLLDGIVTRNIKDFKKSDIKVYSPNYFDNIG